MAKTSLVLLLCYLVGCFTTGYYLVRFQTGENIGKMFSGNAGSRNAGRVLGVKGFLITFIGDIGKGMLAVWLAKQTSSEAWISLAALIAVTAGHIWPVQLHFNGGKGLATFAGGMILIFPLVFGVSLIVCGILYLLTIKLENSVIITLTFTPLILMSIQYFEKAELQWQNIFLYLMLVGIILSAHRAVIKGLF